MILQFISYLIISELKWIICFQLQFPLVECNYHSNNSTSCCIFLHWTGSKCYISIWIISEINVLNLAYNVTGQFCAYRDLQHMLDVNILVCLKENFILYKLCYKSTEQRFSPVTTPIEPVNVRLSATITSAPIAM